MRLTPRLRLETRLIPAKDTLLSPPPHPGVQMGTGELLGKPDEMQGEEGGEGWAGKLLMD